MCTGSQAYLHEDFPPGQLALLSPRRLFLLLCLSSVSLPLVMPVPEDLHVNRQPIHFENWMACWPILFQFELACMLALKQALLALDMPSCCCQPLEKLLPGCIGPLAKAGQSSGILGGCDIRCSRP